MIDKPYYREMLKKERLVSFYSKEKLVAFVTFYIGGMDEQNKFFRKDSWEILDDNKDGSVCYIDQLINKDKTNLKEFFRGWIYFKSYLKKSFRNVRYVCWRRWNKKTNKVNFYSKEI